MGEPAKEGTMSAKKATQKSAKSTTASKKTSEGFTAEERAAMKERAQELKASARRGPRTGEADGESDVLAKIAWMPAPDRAMEPLGQGAIRCHGRAAPWRHQSQRAR